MDRSLTRAVIIKGLVMHGYPDEEIVVIAEQLLDWGHAEEKGAAWFLTDVCRLIAKYRVELPLAIITPTMPPATTPQAKGTKKRAGNAGRKKERQPAGVLTIFLPTIANTAMPGRW
jgi:hypothetical protein